MTSNKRQEFWIYDAGDSRDHIRKSKPSSALTGFGYTHVREVLGGEICITREDLKKALLESYSDESERDTWKYLESNLWPKDEK